MRLLRGNLASAVRFDSPELATGGKSTSEVLRGWAVFKLFTYDSIVDNSLKVGLLSPHMYTSHTYPPSRQKQLFSVGQKLLGKRLFESLMRSTVFGQFAGGVDEADAAKTCAKLSRKGISSVWQYSVEQDMRLARGKKSDLCKLFNSHYMTQNGRKSRRNTAAGSSLPEAKRTLLKNDRAVRFASTQ